MPYNNLRNLEHSEKYSNRIFWVFCGIFPMLAFYIFLLISSNPINATIIHFNLDEYQDATFKATRVIEIRRIPRLPSDYPKNWVSSRQLIGELKLNSGVTETGFIAGRHLEKIYKLEDANTPSLNALVIGSSVKVLYNPSMQSESGGESLAVISADRSDHIAGFWTMLMKTLVFLLWLMFCAYMWITNPKRFEHRKEQAIRKNFELRKLNRNRNVNE